MCDFEAGQLIVMRPIGDGPAAIAALRTLQSTAERYGAHRRADLDGLLASFPPPAWHAPSKSDQPHTSRQSVRKPFYVELMSVPEGAELSVAEEIRNEFLDAAATDEKALREISSSRYQRLHVSPNWRMYTTTGTPEIVSGPFTLVNHHAYLKRVGLDTAAPGEAQGITVAVLDNGFAAHFWSGAPSPPPVAAGQDLIPSDTSTAGHGTLVAALIAASAPGANVVPIRMAGTESTEWDTLHALAKAVQIGAHVINLSYRQILGADQPCPLCGLVRTAARSEVFATMVDWASDNGKRSILAAAGNDGIGSIARPAAYKGAHAIAALDSQGTGLWSRSNWDGSRQHEVLALPGENVAADAAGGPTYSGTSFATAYATALFAVGMGRYSTTDASVVIKNLLKSSPTTILHTRVPSL